MLGPKSYTKNNYLSSKIDLDIKINSVFVASICSKNETPAKAKRGLNEIYTKYKEYDIYKESIEYIKTVEINEFGMFFSTLC